MKKKKHLKGKGEFVYDFKYDILTFKIKDRNYKESIELQNFVADVDEEGFVTGLRIFDASKVCNLDKYVLRNVVMGSFKATIENNILSIVLKFSGKRRNTDVDFVQQMTTPINNGIKLIDSQVECPLEAA